jgi:hypothetical protein
MGLSKILKKYGHHYIWHMLVKPLEYLTFAVAAYAFNFAARWINGEKITIGWVTTLDYVKDNPIRVLFPLVFATVIFVLYRLVRSFAKVVVERAHLANEVSLLRKRLGHIGLRDFLPHDSAEKRSADWVACAESISEDMPQQLSILGAGGYETFGVKGAPLYELVSNFTGEIRILLLDPSCDAFEKRCGSLGHDKNKYSDWIYTTIELCARLQKQKGRKLEVRLYQDAPIWKMIFTPSYLWLQYYDPAKDVDETSVYLFQASVDPYRASLYYPLSTVFLRRWVDPRTRKVDLANFRRP